MLWLPDSGIAFGMGMVLQSDVAWYHSAANSRRDITCVSDGEFISDYLNDSRENSPLCSLKGTTASLPIPFVIVKLLDFLGFAPLILVHFLCEKIL